MRAFLRDQQGATLVFVAVGLFASAGMAALAVDIGYFYVLKNRLQTTADVAVLAAAGQLPDADAVRTTALAYTAKNMAASAHGTVLANADVVTGNWDSDTRIFTAAGAPTNAVQVITRRSQANGNVARTFFANVIGIAGVDITTLAIAIGGGTSPSCVLALADSGQAMYLNSDSAIEATGCDVQVNSTESDALVTNSGSTATADSICVTGDYEGDGYSPAPDTGCAPEPDPLAGLPDPAISGPCITDKVVNSSSETLDPGRYCGKLEINSGSIAYLNPGLYIMDDATFIANSDSTIIGDDVTIYLTGSDGYLKFNSDSPSRCGPR